MRPFFTLLALFAFSLHLLLGCCAHHAHGQEGLSGHQHAGHAYNHIHLPAWLCSSAPQAGCHHGDHEHDHGHDSQPTPHVPCADPDCVFVEAGGVQFSAATDVALLPVTADEQVVAAYDPTVTSSEFLRQRDISPHVRRHLALSHFLN